MVPMDPRAGVPMDAYAYELPESAIAQHPLEPRSAARLLVGPGLAGAQGSWPQATLELPDGTARTIGHASVADLPRLVGPGDVLVVNDTRVLAGRLALHKTTGGAAEVLLLEPHDAATGIWEALVRPGKRLPPGTPLVDREGGPPVVEVLGVLDEDDGRRLVRLVDPTVVERVGVLPLPPYIRAVLDDPARYQTVFAADQELAEQSSAAPTAGLHFTPELLAECRRAGAAIHQVDLAIGLDTFRPVTADRPEDHRIHTERYSVPEATWEACRSARRVIAVGTTALRALESVAATGRRSGRTDLFIHGTYPFAVVDALVTNFHLPRSSLLLLVEAFVGPLWRPLYEAALQEGYRFLSFGDAMILGRSEAGAAS